MSRGRAFARRAQRSAQKPYRCPFCHAVVLFDDARLVTSHEAPMCEGWNKLVTQMGARELGAELLTGGDGPGVDDARRVTPNAAQVVQQLDRFPCYACGRGCTVARALDGSGDMILHAEPPCDVFEHSDPDAFAMYCYQKARGSAQA